MYESLPPSLLPANPAIFIADSVQHVVLGTNTLITATVYAIPEVDKIEWFLDGTLIVVAGNPHYSVNEAGNELQILDATSDLLGLYRVEASLDTSVAHDEVNITVPGKE